MPLLSLQNKNKLVGGIITTCFLAFGVLLKEWFAPEKNGKSSIVVQNNGSVISNQSKDTSNLILNSNQLIQKNDNKGNVHNEIVGRDKITTYITPKQRRQADTVKVPNIINKGNLSMNQQGGTVNQNTYNNTKPQRNLNQDDIKMLESNLPDTIYVEIPENDKESYNFGYQIANHLKSLEHHVIISYNLLMSGFNIQEGERFRFLYNQDHTQVTMIMIFPQL